MTTAALKPSENGAAPLATIAPSVLDEFLPSERLMKYCEFIATSNLVPKDFRGRPADVLLAIQMGLEIGLKPAQAVQSIAVINGRPSIWGDAALAVIKQHRDYESCEETITGEGDKRVATCTIKRKGEPPVVRTFCVFDAKRAKLWDKEGPWKTYPDRMLQMRARGFAGRDAFPDALKGLSFAEEAMDIPATDTAATAAATQSRTDQVKAKILGTAAVDDVPAASETIEHEPAAPSGATPPAAAPGADDKVKAREYRIAIGKAWNHVAEVDRKAILMREYAKSTLLDLTTGQLEDFLARTPELLPTPAPEAAE